MCGCIQTSQPKRKSQEPKTSRNDISSVRLTLEVKVHQRVQHAMSSQIKQFLRKWGNIFTLLCSIFFDLTNDRSVMVKFSFYGHQIPLEVELVCGFYDYYCNPKLHFWCKLVCKGTLHRKKILGYVILDPNVIGSYQKLIFISNCIFFFNTVKRMIKNGNFSALFVKLCNAEILLHTNFENAHH